MAWPSNFQSRSGRRRLSIRVKISLKCISDYSFPTYQQNNRIRDNKTYAVSAQNSLASLLPISQSGGKTAPIPVRSKSVNLRTNHLYLQNEDGSSSLTSSNSYYTVPLFDSINPCCFFILCIEESIFR